MMVELRQADVADIALEPRARRLNVDDLALQGELQRLFLAFALDRQRDLAVRRPTHLVDGIVEREPLDALPAQREDQAPRFHPAPPAPPTFNRPTNLAQTP